MKNVIIVGGGSAGWMTAATLIKAFPNKKITVIESPDISTVGVGESTIGGIRNWTNFVGIHDQNFLSSTDGIYKLSIRFQDFYKKGTHFHYPFGQPITRENDWWYKKFMNPKLSNSDYADCMFPQMAFINKNKLSYNNFKVQPFNFNTDTAYHFDATKFAIWLRDNLCIPQGVKHIKENIKSIEQNEDGIKSLNKKHKADLFVDCTGFKSLLLGETLKEPFESYSDLLPNDSAWATKIPYKNKKKELVPYTNCTAIENGWVWNIPLWSRIGTGYVYSSKFVDDETALKQLQKHLGTKDLDFKNVKMRVGIHKRLWVKNVAAIGLSAGFIEPLESNGLYSVHEFLFALIRNLEREHVSQWDKDNFTFECKSSFRNFAEFVALHYSLTQRTDTEYWKNNFNKTWEEKLYTLDPSNTKGLFRYVSKKTFEYFYDQTGGSHAISAGMNWPPTTLNSIKWITGLNKEALHDNFWKDRIEALDNRKKVWEKAVSKDLSFYDFMLKNIYQK